MRRATFTSCVYFCASYFNVSAVVIESSRFKIG